NWSKALQNLNGSACAFNPEGSEILQSLKHATGALVRPRILASDVLPAASHRILPGHANAQRRDGPPRATVTHGATVTARKLPAVVVKKPSKKPSAGL